MTRSTSWNLLILAALVSGATAASAVQGPLPIAWTDVSPGVSPEARAWHKVVFDSDRGKAILFGGETATGVQLNDVWEFDFSTRTWVDITPPIGAVRPRPRSRFGMAYDPLRHRVIVYGGTLGVAGDVSNGETWEFDPVGRQWTLINAPGIEEFQGRIAVELAFDPNRGQVILFGGMNYWECSVRQKTQTFAFDGARWNQVASSGPVGRVYHVMATDFARSRVVMYGGAGWDECFGVLDSTDTWEWNGTAWLQVATGPNRPATNRGGGIAFDSNRNRMVYFGGGISNRSWEWDGLNWVERPTIAPAPTARVTPLVYDPATRRLMLFGGLGGLTPIVRAAEHRGGTADTWLGQLFDQTAPIITPIITGTFGTPGWYVGDVTVSWTVADSDTPVTSMVGCTTTTIATDTAGTTLTCSATSDGGTSTLSVVIRRDTTAPVVSVTQPVWGGILAVGATVNAAFSCSDATAGIASCNGTLASGAALDTATTGARVFSVSATDQAGNATTTHVSYTVFTPTDGRNIWLWRNTYPSRHLAIFPDGTLVAQTWNNFTAPLVNPASGAVTSFPGGFPQGSTGVAPNPVVWADSAAAYLIGGWAGPTTYSQTGVFKWRWDNEFGCCNNMGVPNMAVDRGRRRLLLSLGNRLYFLPLDTGTNPTFAGGGGANGLVAATSQFAYVAGVTRDVTKWSITGAQPTMEWTRQLSTAFDTWNFSEGAITADGSFVVTRSGSHASGYWAGGDVWRAGDLHYVAADNSSTWTAEANASTPPVVGRSGLIYVGGPVAGAPQGQLNGPGVVTAYSPSGQRIWTAPTAGLPQDLLIGDDNRLYVAVGGSNEGAVLALDASTGTLALAINHLPSPWEILLRSGVIYVNGDTGIAALPLPPGFAVNYDRQAPWPVRQHDNQRTSLGGDTTPPVVTVPGNLVVEAASPAGAAVTFFASALDETDGQVPVSCTPASGAVFGLGTTTVTCTASDGAGNSASASFAVVVVDSVAPAITQLVDPGIDSLFTTASAFVKVRATDAVGVIRVKANGTPLSLVSGTALDGLWEATVPAVPFQQLTLNVTAEDTRPNVSSQSFVIDGDGIVASIDRKRADYAIDESSVYSSEFNDGITAGSVDRQGSVVQVRSLNIDGIQAVDILQTEFLTIPGQWSSYTYVCGGSGLKYVFLNSVGERAAVACRGNANTTLWVKALVAYPVLDLYKQMVICDSRGICRLYIYHVVLRTGQSASIGSPVAADSSNTEPISVEVARVNDNGSQEVIGSYQLDPGETADAEVVAGGAAGDDQLVFSVLQGEVTVTIGTDVVTVGAGETVTARVDQFAQTISFDPIPNKSFGDPAFALAATASSGLPVTFIASGACTLSGSIITPVGTGSCTVTASQAGDLNYLPAAAVRRTFFVWHSWSGIQQPVNSDGSSIFKLGRTVPVKFQLIGGSAAITNLQARIYVAKISNSVVGTEVEATSTAASDAGNTFRYDASAGAYIFNWGTQGLTSGTWQIRVDLLDGNPARIVVVSLRQ